LFTKENQLKASGNLILNNVTELGKAIPFGLVTMRTELDLKLVR